jgi:DnaJ-class molecular chaperone
MIPNLGHGVSNGGQPALIDRKQDVLTPYAPLFLPCVQASAGNCPYSTLGVSAKASDTEIKQAYRKLVLQYHPDVCQSSGADRRFMTIQQAYELLTGKSRSAEGHSAQHGDWDFHDW